MGIVKGTKKTIDKAMHDPNEISENIPINDGSGKLDYEDEYKKALKTSKDVTEAAVGKTVKNVADTAKGVSNLAKTIKSAGDTAKVGETAPSSSSALAGNPTAGASAGQIGTTGQAGASAGQIGTTGQAGASAGQIGTTGQAGASVGQMGASAGQIGATTGQMGAAAGQMGAATGQMGAAAGQMGAAAGQMGAAAGQAGASAGQAAAQAMTQSAMQALGQVVGQAIKSVITTITSIVSTAMTALNVVSIVIICVILLILIIDALGMGTSNNVNNGYLSFLESDSEAAQEAEQNGCTVDLMIKAVNEGAYDNIQLGLIAKEDLLQVLEFIKDFNDEQFKETKVVHDKAEWIADVDNGWELTGEYEDDGARVVNRASIEEGYSDNSKNSSKFAIKWQEVVALIIYKSSLNAGSWGENIENYSGFSSLFTNLGKLGKLLKIGMSFDDYFLSDSEIESACEIFNYDITYYWDVQTGAISEYKWENMSHYSWKYHDINDECEEGIFSDVLSDTPYSSIDELINNMAYYDGVYNPVYSCKEPASAPLKWESCMERCTYTVIDVSDEYLREQNEDLIKSIYGEYSSQNEDCLDDLGGIITGRTIQKTPHKFVESCEEYLGQNFDFSYYISILSQLPDTDKQVEEIQELQRLYLSTEDDNDKALIVCENDTNFKAYGTCIGKENATFSGMGNEFGVGFDFYMYVDKKSGKDAAVANAYYYFPAGSLSYQICDETRTYTLDNMIAYVNAHDWKGAGFVGHEEELAQGLYMANQIYKISPAFILGNSVSEQSNALKSYREFSKGILKSTKRVERQSSSVNDGNYYGWGAYDGTKTIGDLARTSYYVAGQSGLKQIDVCSLYPIDKSYWQSNTPTTSPFILSEMRDWIGKYGTSDLKRMASQEADDIKLLEKLVAKNAILPSYQPNFKGIVRNYYAEQAVQDFNQYIYPDSHITTNEFVSSESLQNAYSVVYFAERFSSTYSNRNGAPQNTVFEMCWKGIDMTETAVSNTENTEENTEENTDTSVNEDVYSGAIPMYRTKSEVIGYTMSHGSTQSDKIFHSYTSWWAGSYANRRTATDEDIAKEPEIFEGDSDTKYVVTNHKVANLTNYMMQEQSIMDNIAGSSYTEKDDEEEDNSVQEDTSNDAASDGG